MKQTRITFIFIIVGISLFLSSGCRRYPDDKRLLALSKIVSDRPEEVILSLDSIDKNSLSSRNRHYYDLLWIKARDKAYIIHESDSLILDVINYYKGNPDLGLYAEALYYGGRVYSDLGDNPTALKYFQESLDNLGDSEQDLELKYRLLSQTGRLLNTLRLYDEAIEYVNKALEIERKWNDTVKIVNDLQLLSSILIRKRDLDKSEYYLKEAESYGKNLPLESRALTKLYLAETKYRKGNIDSALIFIENAPYKVSEIERNTALSRGALIYLEAGMLDTAYKYAEALIHNPDKSQQIIGYNVILSPELRSYIPYDSIDAYISHYRGNLERLYNENTNQLAISQQSFYNYKLHEKAEKTAKDSNVRLNYIILGLIVIIFMLISIIFVLKYRKKSTILKLKKSIEITNDFDNINKKDLLESKFLLPRKKIFNDKDSIKELREELRNNLIRLYDLNEDKEWRTKEFIDSKAYKKLQTLINGSESIKEQDPLWNELETTLLKFYPDFKSNLQVLLRGRLSLSELQTSILIKYGVSPNQMAILLNRSKNTIVSRRNTIGLKIFDEKMPPKIIDSIIRIL